MTYAPQILDDDAEIILRMPSWVTRGQAEAIEDVAFLSGAALSHLHLVLAREDIPQALLRARLALRAAEACVAHRGRSERAGDLRDAVAFLQPGDNPGPAGEIYRSWRSAIARPVSVKALQKSLPGVEAQQIATWIDASTPYDGRDPCDEGGPGDEGDPYDGGGPTDGGNRREAGQGGPVARAAQWLEAVLADRPRDVATALLLADAALARAVGWTHVVPLLGHGLKRRNLRLSGADLRLACHRAAIKAAMDALREAADLSRRAARLHAVLPKLRAKGAEKAAALFLEQDALAPTALTSLRSDRAARRFCDRLVELGAVRELTGRDTFRLYGI